MPSPNEGNILAVERLELLQVPLGSPLDDKIIVDPTHTVYDDPDMVPALGSTSTVIGVVTDAEHEACVTV